MSFRAGEARTVSRARCAAMAAVAVLFGATGQVLAGENDGLGDGEEPQGGFYSGPITPGAAWYETNDVPPAFNWGDGEPVFADDGPFTFDGSYCVYVTDAYATGDEFAVYDNGELLGNTSAVAGGDGFTGDPDVAFADPAYSSGVFPVGPGSHSITIEVTANPFGGGAAYIQVVDCPADAGENRTTINVTKDFSDDNPGEVEVMISCNTGLPLEQTKIISESEPVEFVITEFDSGELDCAITEAGIVGYDAGYDNGVTTSDTSCSYEDLEGGLELSCDITNTPAPVDVVIEKDWIIEGADGSQGVNTDYRLTLWCDAEIIGGINLFEMTQGAGTGNIIGPPGCGLVVPGVESGQIIVPLYDWCKSFNSDGDDVFNAEVIPEYPNSNCYVVETVYDSAVEVDNGCGSLTVSAGQGASCTITNTVFFEGIPTLNQYGMALLALLMLGMGFIGFRRFA
ncbi:IPTL-CTERM sorting domain-containing protein [Elongatibacter sediminis]|uniref:IPTL-CTERM sorting domain-containing protein n=1 Tax=Elongatibacter sediminis TaxID=3119006 RepID=A0AAW9RMY7_9GAMM